MTAPVLIKCKTATFKSKSIASAQQASIGFSGSSQKARGDGASANQIAYVEGIEGKVTVTALQGSITDNDLILPGNGALVIVGFQQAPGSGAVGGSDKTWTFPNATLESTERGVPIDGNPTVNLTFSCVADSGVPADIYSVA